MFSTPDAWIIWEVEATRMSSPGGTS